MRTTLSILLFLVGSISLAGQNPDGDFNPYVGSGELTPSPLQPSQADGAGIVRFEIGNTGDDPLEVFSDQYITLTITLSYGEVDSSDPLGAVSGTAAELFSWSYNDGTYSAKQISPMAAGYSGIVTIAYKVTRNSAAPGINGFNVNISPAPYQTNSNLQEDDAVSYYTYTSSEDMAPTAPTNLTLVSASELFVLITWNTSSGLNGIEGYKVYRDNEAIGSTVDPSYSDSTVVSGSSYVYAVSAVDSLGNESELSESLSVSVLSMSEIEIQELIIKPNPADGIFHIFVDSLFGEFYLEIVSTSGSIVLQKKVEFHSQAADVALNSKDFDSGVYTIRIYNPNKILYGKFIIIP